MGNNLKHYLTLGLLGFSFPIIVILANSKELKMFWSVFWAVGYFVSGVAFEYKKNKKYNLRLIQEYALYAILGIALMAGVIYYE